MPLKAFKGFRAPLLGAVAAFVTLASSSIPSAQAQVFCWQVTGCTGTDGCQEGGCVNRCNLYCYGGAIVYCASE